MKTPLWEGVYESFSEVPIAGPGFSGGDWLEQSTEKLEELRSLAAKNGSVSQLTGYTESLLPVVAAMVQAKLKTVRILDFGGGLGFSYYQVLQGLPSSAGLEFHIIDIEAVCAAGELIFSDEPQIVFHSALTDVADQRFDIVHIGSSLQYIGLWQEQLTKLCRLEPEYVLMANIPAGDIETFATAQNYYGSKIACWFFSVADLTESMSDNGFELVFKSSYFTKVYGVEQPYPLDNFEPDRRVEYPCMLLFQKVSK